MSSAVAELDGYLQSMLSLKPPGVSGSKITSITSLCTANVQSESVLIQKIYTHFKKAPGTHKLGVLYVVDSVTRQWVDQARKAGQTPGSGAPDGTFAAGVNRVTELLPVLLTDIINTAPEDQKARIKKLLDIWERSNTFPVAMLSSIKEKLDAPKPNNAQSTTPEGTPSPDTIMTDQQRTNPNPPAPAQNTSAILAALASMAKQSSSAPAAPGIPAQASMHNVLGQQNGQPQPPAPSVDQAQSATNGQAVNPLGALFAGMTGMSNGGQGMNQNQNQNPIPMTAQPNPLAALLPQMQSQAQVPVPHAMPQNSAAVSPDVQQQVQLIQLMAAQGIPPEQWATALQLLNPNAPKLGAAGMPNFGQPPQASAWGGQSDGRSRDVAGQDYVRSPTYGRRRSRSPGWDRRRDVSPPRRRDSPVYGEYHGDSPGRNRDRAGRRDYRQRSPPGRRRRSPSPPQALPPPGQKVIQWENLPKGMIKVLSRTLFVGGVTSSDAHLRSLFSAFGTVQTCIVNTDKRHAFVKMINRQDAVKAREGMEQFKSGDMQLRTRWGVGFGPRDCSDYQTGISIIPIDRLTDADRKWMLSAEYGGTGGRPIESGMVVEEPDIEIGAGVSSKAISRRMATDQGGKHGPQSSRGDNRGSNRNDGRNRFRNGYDDRDRDNNQRDAAAAPINNPNPNTIGVPPSVPPPVPGFGFNFANGMPMFPPGFMMPTVQAQQQQQQPPGNE
ncbi:hypothetical protein GJ744_008367 [Endocarpon pusillum]|uniref:RNA binding protein Nrd1 n=1 Tax=Endocarpon pusillum TaxID=364733 RepID=A0A8H7E5D2_9EURO|nr:hypothetical protein GJ744_008367 [Endocarpon pusillum]